jgi:hypothetical protein
VTGNIQAVLNSQGQVYFQNLAYPLKSVSGASQSQYGYWEPVGGSVTLTDVLGDTIQVNVPGNGGDTGGQFPVAASSCF